MTRPAGPKRDNADQRADRSLAPIHVGLVPDGTRRWAQRTGVTLAAAYDYTFDRVVEITDRLWSEGVQAVSVYLLSYKNLGRTAAELNPVYAAETRICRDGLAAVAEAWDARVTPVGELDSVPHELSAALAALAKRRARGARRLYLLVAYDPRFELLKCAGSLPQYPGDPLRALAVPEPLNLVIRTSGVRSPSDFLPLQASYSEIRFVSEGINDISDEQIIQLLKDYAETERRRGL
jgi:undecaprenyl pyrophosphate synthase